MSVLSGSDLTVAAQRSTKSIMTYAANPLIFVGCDFFFFFLKLLSQTCAHVKLRHAPHVVHTRVHKHFIHSRTNVIVAAEYPNEQMSERHCRPGPLSLWRSRDDVRRLGKAGILHSCSLRPPLLLGGLTHNSSNQEEGQPMETDALGGYY